MEWVWTATDGTWSVQGKNVWIWIAARPHYCDRGNYLAHIGVRVDGDALKVGLDSQDLWPRYYFDLDRAKAECEAWLVKRGEAI